MMRQFELVERVKSYDPDADEDAINRAYVYAMKMHGLQKRASGDPYFSHPIEVAGILTNYKLDTASIVTALLLFGCAYPAASQPRALGVGNMQPACLIFCFQTNTQTDAESGATQSATTTSSQSADVGLNKP